MASRGTVEARAPEKGRLGPQHLSLLNYDALYFELEQFKRERTWHNLNITKGGVRTLLADQTWYTLYIPPTRMEPSGYENVQLWQQVAAELLKRYAEHYYNYRKGEFIEPRLELRDLTADDDNLPKEEQYQLIVDGSEEQLIQSIQKMREDLERCKNDLLQIGDLYACKFDRHLYEPLFHVRKGGKIVILPVALNESEYQFVEDLKKYCEANRKLLAAEGKELFLLRNMSRGRGVGFFEAGNFYPDFILWLLVGDEQYVTFIEPHGLLHEGPASSKLLFYKKIKEVEARLDDPKVVLNSFILSWSRHASLNWGQARKQMEEQHVLFMTEDKAGYISRLLALVLT